MKGFWQEIWEMTLRRHGINRDSLWPATLLILGASLMGIFLIPKPWWYLALLSLILAIVVEIWGFFIQLPVRKWRQDLHALGSQIASLTPLQNYRDE